MPRRVRYFIPGYPQHVTQRGNNRQTTFHTDRDFAVYRRYLGEALEEHECEVHAYCFMTNHVHLLVTPRTAHAISKVIHAVAGRYVGYFNRVYGRTGALWEGRFRANLVGDDAYALTCHRYIELNPVRARLVDRPEQYPHSSHRHNALGERDSLIREHAVYLDLGASPRVRFAAYRRLFADALTDAELETIRRATNSSEVFGSELFKDRIERLLNRSVRRGVPGPRRKKQLRVAAERVSKSWPGTDSGME